MAWFFLSAIIVMPTRSLNIRRVRKASDKKRKTMVRHASFMKTSRCRNLDVRICNDKEERLFYIDRTFFRSCSKLQRRNDKKSVASRAALTR